MIEIHQALFGYEHGHRLLAASRHLSTSAVRTILPLTDPPDLDPKTPNIIGFPLPGEDLYFLGQTWSAPELPRPGCVWTHLLILAISDLRAIPRASSLKNLWRRPSQNFDRSYFEVPLSFEPSRDVQTLAEIGILKPLIENLYGHPEKSIWFPSKVEGLDELSLAIWEQQWPRLRAEFRFCTGGKSPRYIGEKVFDLHLSSIQFRGAREAGLLSGSGDPISNGSNVASWVSLLTRDLIHPNSDVRAFLWKYGEEVSLGRSAMTPLLNLYLLMNTLDVLPREVVQSLAVFPKSELSSLKAALLVGDARPEFNDADLLMALIEIETDSFDAEQLRLNERIRSWVSEAQPVTLMNLLTQSIRGPRTEVKDSILSTIRDVVPVRIEALAQHADDRAFRLLLKRFPEVATHESIWQSPHLQRRLWSAVSSLRLNHKLRHEISVMAVQFGTRDVVTDLTGEWGTRDWHAALTAAVEKGITPSDPWCIVIEKNLEIVLESEPEVEVLALLATTINPLSQRVLTLGSTPWRPLADSLASLRGDQQTDIAAFLFCVGARSTQDDGRDLVDASFPVLHSALAKTKVAPRAWSILDRFLPKLKDDEAWDRCERLRLALLRTIHNRGWPEDVIVSAARDEKTLGALSETARRERTTRRVFRRLTDNFVARNLPRELREVLEGLLQLGRSGK